MKVYQSKASLLPGSSYDETCRAARKEHKKVEQLEAIVAQQRKGIEVLAANFKEQAAQIQKVNNKLEASKPAPQVAVNNP